MGDCAAGGLPGPDDDPRRAERRGGGAPPPRLLHVFPTFALGGSQRRTIDLANALGRDFAHVVLAIDGEVSASRLLDPGVAVSFRRGVVRRSSGLAPGNLLRLRRLLREVRPDLLLTYNFGTIEAALANRLWPLCPHVHFEDGFGPEEAGGRQLPRRVWARRLALSGNSRVVVPSRTLERIALDAWRLRRGRVLYLPNGIDTAHWAAAAVGGGAPPAWWRAGEMVVGSVGVFRPEKNFARLLRAFARLPREMPARLVLVGDGPERGALEALAAGLGIAGRVTFTGHLLDPRPALHRFDVFALGSDTEQMPYSLVEAMAAGLAVVATDVGDVRAMLPAASREEAVVVPVADEAGFARRLEALLRDPARRAAAGARHRAHARENYDLGAMVRQYDALFRGLIGRSGTGIRFPVGTGGSIRPAEAGDAVGMSPPAGCSGGGGGGGGEPSTLTLRKGCFQTSSRSTGEGVPVVPRHPLSHGVGEG